MYTWSKAQKVYTDFKMSQVQSVSIKYELTKCNHSSHHACVRTG